MKRNEKGFTLIELMATLVILGVIMAVAVPNVVGILNSNRVTTYLEDAKKLVTVTEYKFRGDNTLQKPTADGDCIIASLRYLDNSEFENPPYGGKYSGTRSFVIMKRNTNSYEYYVQLIEKMPNEQYHGIKLSSSEKLYEKSAGDAIANFTASALPKVVSDSDAAAIKTYSATVSACNNIVRVYAVDNDEED